MDPTDTQRTRITGAPSPEPGTGAPPPGAGTPPRRLHPGLWALLPVVALLCLGFYLLGKMVAPPPETAAPEPTQQPIVATKPPPPPRGQITVTEVPRAITPPNLVTPTTPPALNAPPRPQPAKTPKLNQEEAPVVLPPPDPEDAPADDTSTDAGGAPAEGGDAGADAGAEDTPRAPSEADRDPVKINDPAQEYPASAYEEGAEGTVRVNFTITADGSVSEARVGQSSGDNRLDAAAVDYVKRLRFRPAIRGGRAAAVPASRTVRFTLR